MNRIYIFIALLTVLASCKNRPEEEAGSVEETIPKDVLALSPEQISMAGIKSSIPRQMLLSELISCNGIVQVPARDLIRVSVPVGGIVKSLHVNSGDPVKKGDLLVRLEDPQYIKLQQEYIESRNELLMLREEFDRQKELAEQNAASEKKMRLASTSYENMLAKNKSLEGQLQILGVNPQNLKVEELSPVISLHSPINGHIRDEFTNTGDYISPEDPILLIQNLSGIYGALKMYEKDIASISKGMHVEFTTETGQKTYRGRISSIGKLVREESRTVDVRVMIDNQDRQLLPGMYIKARIFLAKDSVYALPSEAIIEESGQSYIFIEAGNKFRRIPISTGTVQDDYTEIRSDDKGLFNKSIVHRGAYYLNAEFQEEE